MATYFEPVLSEEQLAAYLDGMLSPEENNMIEDIIASDPEMEEIQETIDSVDSSYIYEADEEIPIECFADDFSMPNTDNYDQYEEHDHHESYCNHEDYGYHEDSIHHEDNCVTDDFPGNEYDDTNDDFQEEPYNLICQNDSFMDGHDDSLLDNSFDDLSF